MLDFVRNFKISMLWNQIFQINEMIAVSDKLQQNEYLYYVASSCLLIYSLNQTKK